MLANGVEEYVTYNLVPANARNKLSQEEMGKILDFIYSNGREAFDGCLLAIYRIRNNMFHGLKELDSLNGQLELFKTMNRVLEEIIG